MSALESIADIRSRCSFAGVCSVVRIIAALSVLLVSCTAQETERWESSTIDGRPASGFVLAMRGGEVVGGHDGCNGWGISEHPDLIVMETEECPPDSTRDVYWVLARGNETAYSRQGSKLIARGGQHTGVFVRA